MVVKLGSFSVSGSKNIHERKTEKGKKCVHVVVGEWLVYMGGYSIASESLRAHKSYVFVEQQKLRKRKGGIEWDWRKIMKRARPPSVEGHKKREEIYLKKPTFLNYAQMVLVSPRRC